MMPICVRSVRNVFPCAIRMQTMRSVSGLIMSLASFTTWDMPATSSSFGILSTTRGNTAWPSDPGADQQQAASLPICSALRTSIPSNTHSSLSAFLIPSACRCRISILILTTSTADGLFRMSRNVTVRIMLRRLQPLAQWAQKAPFAMSHAYSRCRSARCRQSQNSSRQSLT